MGRARLGALQARAHALVVLGTQVTIANTQTVAMRLSVRLTMALTGTSTASMEAKLVARLNRASALGATMATQAPTARSQIRALAMEVRRQKRLTAAVPSMAVKIAQLALLVTRFATLTLWKKVYG